MQPLIIATRASPLALWQAEFVKHALESLHPNYAFELLKITTSGDRFLNTALRQIGGKGLFIKELEEAMLSGKADLAVHSMKDVPMILPEELTIAAICKREDPRDCLVSNQYVCLDQIPKNACIGTASLRRKLQLKLHRPDLIYQDLRGNIHTRLNKLKENQFSAIVLAAAGLKRMNFFQDSSLHIDLLSPEASLPAAGQGALAIECKKKSLAEKLITPLHDLRSAIHIQAERALCRELDGGCQIPLAAFADDLDQDGTIRLRLRAQIINPINLERLQTEVISEIYSEQDAETLGKQAAAELFQQGAAAIIKQLRDSHDIEFK